MSYVEEMEIVDLAEDSVSELIDLSPQLRNQRLLDPINQLYNSRNYHINDAGQSIFDGLDSNYLCMATLNFMMEGSAVGSGRSMGEVNSYVRGLIARIQPDKPPDECAKAADTVISTLSNRGDNYKEYECTYFHAPSMETRVYRFRLVRLEPDPDAPDVYRYNPTAEGYLLLIGMLDVDVEDQQILMEKMLRILIDRGRFEQAAEFARRAKVLSVDYRQYINSQIAQAIRSPRSVKWASDLKPRLDDSRKHVKARQEEEGRLLAAVRDKIGEVEDIKTRTELSSLYELLSSAGNVRARLQLEVTRAEPRFLEAQLIGFRARTPSGIPDLETHLLPHLFDLPIPEIGAYAEDIILSMFPPVYPKVHDLSNVLSILLERRDLAIADIDDESDEEIQPFAVWPEPFPEQVVVGISNWIKSKFAEDRSWKIDELIALGAEEGFSAIQQQCIAFCLYRSFPDSESEFRNHHAVIDGEYDTWVVSGGNLRFDKKHAGDSHG